MSNNTQLNPGVGGDLISTEEIGSTYKIERVKLVTGAAGVDGGNVTDTNPLPVTLQDHQINKMQRISPIGGAMVEQTTRLCGTNFEGTVASNASNNFWVTARATAATAVIGSGIATLTSGTTNSDWCSVVSVRKARFLFANPNMFRALIRFAAVSAANTTTYFGAISVTSGAPQSGFCFAVSASGVVSVQSYTGASAVVNVASGFNGELGTTYTIPDANTHAYEIIYFGAKAWYFIDGSLLHAAAPTTVVMSQLMTNNIAISVINGTSPATRVVECWFASILRFGKELTRPQHSYIAANTTTLCKTGAGTLHRLIIGDGTVGSILIYDGITAGGTLIASIATLNTTPPSTLEFDLDFFVGLTIVTDAGTRVTVVYD